MHPIILIELNEVPHLVLDAYARSSPFMAEWLRASERYTTVAADRIQLDPWIAWPSFHRGVNDETHGLLHLGQSAGAAADYPPLWALLRQHGVSVGVYGSLFSSAEEELSPYAFFVPDVFSPHGRVKPSELGPFQEFNLKMTRASARNADEGVSGGGGRAMLRLVGSGRIRPTTVARVMTQLVAERLDRKKLSRRRNIQTDLHADIFASLVAETRPQFSTFYTNNVAAAMHRFWSAAMPTSSVNRDRLADAWLDAYSDEVFQALWSVERLLRVLSSGRCGDVTIVLASAIGQEEIVAENHRDFLTIVDIRRFAEQVMGAEPGQYELLPTMVPDFTVRFADAQLADEAFARLGSLALDGLEPVETPVRMHSKTLVAADSRLAHIRHEYHGAHFKHEFTYWRSDERTLHVSLQIDDFSGQPTAVLGDEKVPFAELGLGAVPHDEGVNCTAQHCAEGSLVVRRPGAVASGPAELSRVSSLDFVPSVLDYFGVPLPAYLQGEALVALR